MRAGDVVMVRHGSPCLASHAADRAAQGRKGRLSSRLDTANTLIESFSLDPAVYQCVDQGCRGFAKRQVEWWWYLVFGGGAALVMCICAGGVLFSALRNKGKASSLDQMQEPAAEDSKGPEQIEDGAGVGSLIPRP